MASPISCTSPSVYCCIFSQICIQRQVRHLLTDHGTMFKPHVWTDESNSAPTEDEVEVYVLCCHKRCTGTDCDECKEHYCCECIDTTLVGIILC